MLESSSGESRAGGLEAPPLWGPHLRDSFEYEPDPPKPPRRRAARTRGLFASTSTKITDIAPPPSAPPANTKVDLKPASDVLAGAVARAASQGTIHPLDTLKVRMQHASAPGNTVVSKFGRLVPPAGADASKVLQTAGPKIASLYKGVLGAASGAGIYIGTYFAVYGAATNLLSQHTQMKPGSRAFLAGAVAAAGGSVVKVPLAVCIRSVQAGVYPNAWVAACRISAAAGVRGLFTGYMPTLLEDVPDMAFKFAAYESMRSLHSRLRRGRKAAPQEDFMMGAIAGSFAAAATTPLDVIKTQMMCTAASRPSMRLSAAVLFQQGGFAPFFRGVGPRALSNGINSAVFFCFFEALRAAFARQKAERKAAAARAQRPVLLDTRHHSRAPKAERSQLQAA